MDINNANKEKKAIDIAKFLCAILVVAIHTHPLVYGTTADYYFNCFYRIAVPFFFVTTSYFFYTGGGKISKYVRRLLILYACWFCIELPFTIKVHFIDEDGGLVINSLKFLHGLLIGNSFFASWFLTASMEGMLILYLFKNKKHCLFFVGASCFVLGLIWCLWYGLVRNTCVESYYNYFGLAFLPAGSFIIAIPYLIIGKLLAEGKIPNIPYLAYILFIVLVVAELYVCRNSYNKPFDDVYLSLIPLSIILFQVASKIQISDTSYITSICRFLRNSSILIYLLHPVFVYLILQTELINKTLENNSWLLFVIVLICSILLSSIIIRLSKRFGLLKYMY